MSGKLDIFYRILTREQTTGYTGSSVLGSLEEYIIRWCDELISNHNDSGLHRILNNIKNTVVGYDKANPEIRERKIAEMGRMLLSLRDILQNIKDEARKPQMFDKGEEPGEKGLAYKHQGKFSEAIEQFEKALEKNPNNHFALSHLAHIYFQEGNIDESSRLIDMSLKLNPENPFAHSVKGEILFKENKLEESARIFEEILNLNPEDIYAYSKLGVIYRKLGRIQEAESILNRGLELSPNDSALHHALGDVYAWKKEDEKAIEEYQKAVELDPEDSYAFRGLLSSKVKGRDSEAIISQLQKILKIPSRRDNPHLHALLAQHLKREKRYEEAAEEFQEALKLQTNSIYFQTQLAFCYSKMKEYAKVVKLLEPIYKIRSRDPHIAGALAKSYEGLGRIDDARKLLIDILYIHPNDRFLRMTLVNLGKNKSPSLAKG
ncbi:tetratricopeptide repeat protein [Candidatus Poribacteria bacterium]|nr:tetratricopeptide repeat protein [Candidatus Poribacteria bacterium]